MNPRKAYLVVLTEDGGVTEIATGVDCRTFAPEKDVEISATVSSLKPGDRIGLWMPDEAVTLKYRPEYAIRLARGAKEAIVGGRRLNLVEF